MATHSSTLAWKIPWMEKPGRLQSMGSLRVGHDWATLLSLFTFHALEEEMATHSSVLAWRIPGMAGPGGLLSMGSHGVGHDWSDLAVAAAADYLDITIFIVQLMNYIQYIDVAWVLSIRKTVSCSVVSDSLWPHGLVACQAPLSMGYSRHEYWSG